MPKTTDITLGEHFELSLLEEHEQKMEPLRQALIDGEESGEAIALSMQDIKRAAKKKAGLGA